ncbi:MAG: hypothetical protein HND53_11120 [Proteobacteria bacterium]|nr:hypothetical protein [Pseudomonadota bacterium]NOG61044.1 hypothetical protein [Pseudomonadota bacterium]
MNQPKQFNDTNIKRQSKIVWMTMQSSAPILIAIVYFMNKLSLLEAIMPDIRNIFIGLCVISIALPFTLLGFFKRLQNKIHDNLKLGMDNEPAELQRYFTFLLIGMALCELSSMLGLVLYIVAGDYFYSLFFITVSFFLGFLYKPDLE